MQHLIATHGYICRVRADGGGVGVPAGPPGADYDLRRRAHRRRGPRDQPQLSLRPVDIAGLSAQLKAMQASPEPVAASR